MTTVTVVGAGVIGLSVAAELAEAGYDTVVVTRDAVASTTSAVAGAIWWPFHVAPRERTQRWSKVSFTRFEALAADVPEAGVRMLTGTYRTPSTETDRWWEDLPETRLLESGTEADVYELRLPMVDMSGYLPWLAATAAGRGARIEQRAVQHLQDVDGDVVVNCAGLGARDLTGDTDLHALRGQVVLVRRGHVDTFSIDIHGPHGLAHVFPRLDTVVLGGITEDSSGWTRTRPPRTAFGAGAPSWTPARLTPRSSPSPWVFVRRARRCDWRSNTRYGRSCTTTDTAAVA